MLLILSVIQRGAFIALGLERFFLTVGQKILETSCHPDDTNCEEKKTEEENRYLPSKPPSCIDRVSRSALCDFTRKSRIIPRKLLVLRAEKMHQNDGDFT